MRISTSLLAAVGATAAVLTGVVTYSATSAPSPSAAEQSVETDEAPLEPKVRFRPCAKDAELEHGICVTRVVRDVVVSRPSAAAFGTASLGQQSSRSEDDRDDDHAKGRHDGDDDAFDDDAFDDDSDHDNSGPGGGDDRDDDLDDDHVDDSSGHGSGHEDDDRIDD